MWLFSNPLLSLNMIRFETFISLLIYYFLNLFIRYRFSLYFPITASGAVVGCFLVVSCYSSFSRNYWKTRLTNSENCLLWLAFHQKSHLLDHSFMSQIIIEHNYFGSRNLNLLGNHIVEHRIHQKCQGEKLMNFSGSQSLRTRT